jgi:transposase
MARTPTELTREQMEPRRRAAAQLLRAGRLSQAEIARQLSVSRASLSEWAKRLADGGLWALRQHKATGRPARLTTAQQRVLL